MAVVLTQVRTIRWLFGLLCLGLLAACVPPPAPPVAISPPVDPQLVQQRYQRDQQWRRQQLQNWQSQGVLEIRSEKINRRVRAEVQGKEIERAKVTLFGPMQGVAGVMITTPEQIALVDTDQRQITLVPANSSGLNHLIGIALQPEDLLESLLALAAPLQGADPDVAGAWLTRQGETLLLDPVRGVVRERRGQTEGGGSYRALYQWPEESDDAILPMPQQVQIELQPQATRIHYLSRQWQVLTEPLPASAFSFLERYADFVVEQPLRQE
ncbi:MAG: hypothetical protein HQM04_11130 [Magnetococcales bacterium]|nr:hypothetical protein [Magnetococcales bacterium]MBF0115577.1 hypothetical protein [Magnetococcales bacterium]